MHLADLLNPPAWQQHAACRGLDPNLFFPERGEESAIAKAVCETCPVRAACEEAGHLEHYGIWGGLSEKQRRAKRKGQPRRPRPPKPINHGTVGGYSAHLRRGERACASCLFANAERQAERKRKQRGNAA